MPIQCLKCGKKFDVIQFEKGQTVSCLCGALLDLSLLETVEDFERYFKNEEERERTKDIQRDALAICRRILDEARPAVDIEIAREELRQKVKRYFPDKIVTYEMIYEGRFRRLWQQFRTP